MKGLLIVMLLLSASVMASLELKPLVSAHFGGEEQRTDTSADASGQVQISSERIDEVLANSEKIVKHAKKYIEQVSQELTKISETEDESLRNRLASDAFEACKTNLEICKVDLSHVKSDTQIVTHVSATSDDERITKLGVLHKEATDLRSILNVACSEFEKFITLN